MNEIGTNVGKAIKEASVDTKVQSKLKALEDKINEAKLILKTMSVDDKPEVSKEKLVGIIGIFYRTHNYDRQISYLRNKRKTAEFIAQAFGIVASRLDQLEKYKDSTEE